MGFWPFQPSREHALADRLLRQVEAASRQPALFAPGAIPDTLEGRTEAVTVHAVLALARLRADPGAAGLAQLFTDRLFRAFDAGLREAGVGDLTVPKRMRKLAGSFYGRMEAYLTAASDPAALTEAFERNIGVPHLCAAKLAGYVKETMAAQAEMSPAALAEPEAWQAFTP